MPSERKHLDCDKCGTITVTRLVSDYQRWGRQRFFVENLELEVCPQCGARYYPSAAIARIEILAQVMEHAA